LISDGIEAELLGRGEHGPAEYEDPNALAVGVFLSYRGVPLQWRNDFGRFQVQQKRDRSAPLYHQIATRLSIALVTGEFASGDILPGARALAQRLGVATSTVQRAYAELERKGTIETRRGVGTSVRFRTVGGADRTERATLLVRYLFQQSAMLGLSRDEIARALITELASHGNFSVGSRECDMQETTKSLD
jgi:GntR family transcriptional regulator